MKYLDFKAVKNLIVTMLAAGVFLCGCNDQASDTSSIADKSEVSVEVSSEDSNVAPELSTKEALELLERDRLLTEIFVCNSLFGESEKVAKPVPLDDEHEYASFSKIESLLDSTYLADGGNKQYFLSYPSAETPSISEKDGKTFAFYHEGSGFSDYLDEKTAKIFNGETEYEKIIKGKSLSGKDVELKVVYKNDKWLLEKGIFMVNPENLMVSTLFSNSYLGSLPKLSGKILVIEFYITDDKTKFSAEEIQEFHNRVKTGFDVIQTQALDMGGNLEFVYDDQYFSHDGVLGDNALSFDVVFAETGFGTLRGYAESEFITSDYDGYVFAVCLNKEVVTSCERYENTTETQHYFGERIFMGTNTSSSEIAWDLLCLAGMETYETDSYTDSLYRAYFPKDFAVCKEEPVMSKVTAFACGIVSEMESLYEPFIK